jgi:hypothetical protein
MTLERETEFTCSNVDRNRRPHIKRERTQKTFQKTRDWGKGKAIVIAHKEARLAAG